MQSTDDHGHHGYNPGGATDHRVRRESVGERADHRVRRKGPRRIEGPSDDYDDVAEQSFPASDPPPVP